VRQEYVSVSKRRTLDDWERNDEGVWAWLDAAAEDVELQKRLHAWVQRWMAKERSAISEADKAGVITTGVPVPSDAPESP
jgi:hypothetical protein